MAKNLNGKVVAIMGAASFRTRREARAALFEYIEIFYNRQRRHSSIGYCPPPQADLNQPRPALAAA